MKKFLVFAFMLILVGRGNQAQGQVYLTTSDEITISGRTLDSSGFYATPDSVRIVVYRDGVEEHDAWYNSADAQCAAINDMLVFTDAFGDIDDDAGDGLYEVMAGFFEDDGDLYFWKTLWVYLGVDFEMMETATQLLQTDSTKHIYVTSGGNGSNDGLTWATSVCSLRTAEALCTGASSYVIHVGSGSYTAQSCTVDVDYITIIGSGMDRCKLVGANFKPIVYVSSDHFEMSGFYLTYPVNEDGSAIQLVSIDHFSIYHCRFNDVNAGVKAYPTCNYGQIYENIIIDAEADGILLGGSHNWIYGNVIDSVDAEGADAIAMTQESKYNIVSGNMIRVRVGSGIHSTGTWSDNYIVNNFVHSDQGKAYVGATDDSKNSYVGNWEKCRVDTTAKTVQQDIVNAPRDANSDSGWTATRAGYLDYIDAMAVFMGARADGYYQILYPANGTVSKDSVRIFDSGDACKGTIYFHHSNTSTVIDSVIYEKW